jgi:hypothetical protein
MQFAASLVLGEIQLAGPDPAHARTELARLQENARSKGYRVIARKAAALVAHSGASTATHT